MSRKKRRELNVTHQLLICADDDNIVGGKRNATKIEKLFEEGDCYISKSREDGSYVCFIPRIQYKFIIQI
jgi:hypothetical protein